MDFNEFIFFLSMYPTKSLLKLTSVNIENALQELCEVLRSSIGKNSYLKMFTSWSGLVNLTSCSSLIADRLEAETVLCLYINRTIKYLPDSGLYYGVITTHFLKNILKYCNVEGSSHLIGQVKKLKVIVKRIVDSESSKLTLDMSAANVVLLLDCIIGAKPAINLSPHLVSSLSLNILKAFLMSLNDDQIKIEHLLTFVEDGKEEFHTFKGVLHAIDDNYSGEQISKFNSRETKVLLFVSLTFDDEYIEMNTKNRFFFILKNAIKNCIQIIICQKLIDNSMKSFFRSRSVLFFERVGQEVMQSLEFLTTACPLSIINSIDSDDLTPKAGIVTDIQHVTCGIKKYVLFENHQRAVASLLVRTRVLGSSNEMKVVVKQCIDTLCLLVRSPYAVPGGGCFETKLSSQILNSSEDYPRFCDIRTLFCQSLLQISASFPNVYIDRDYRHAWKTNTEGSCRCGMICNQDDIQFECLNVSDSHMSEVKLLEPQKDCKKSANNLKVTSSCSLFDCFQTKYNALLQSLDSVSSILEIGLIIKKY